MLTLARCARNDEGVGSSHPNRWGPVIDPKVKKELDHHFVEGEISADEYRARLEVLREPERPTPGDIRRRSAHRDTLAVLLLVGVLTAMSLWQWAELGEWLELQDGQRRVLSGLGLVTVLGLGGGVYGGRRRRRAAAARAESELERE